MGERRGFDPFVGGYSADDPSGKPLPSRRSEKARLWRWLIAVVIAVIVGVMLIGTLSLANDCRSRGGVLVRGLLWFDCVAVPSSTGEER